MVMKGIQKIEISKDEEEMNRALRGTQKPEKKTSIVYKTVTTMGKKKRENWVSLKDVLKSL